MITGREIVYALAGAVRLAKRDPGGLVYFDDSIPGFWRSFYAAVLAIPLHFIMVMAGMPERTLTVGLPALLLTESIAYVVHWVALPLAMFHICQRLDREERFIRFVVAYNWAALLQISVLAPVALVAGTGLLPDSMAFLLSLIVTGWVLYFQWFIARHALDVPPPVAVGIVVLDLVIGVMVNGVARAIEA
jgi:hypothetical protein